MLPWGLTGGWDKVGMPGIMWGGRGGIEGALTGAELATADADLLYFGKAARNSSWETI